MLARQQLKINVTAISQALLSFKEFGPTISMSPQQAKTSDTHSNEKISGSSAKIQAIGAKRRLLLPHLFHEESRSSCAAGSRLSFVAGRTFSQS